MLSSLSFKITSAVIVLLALVIGGFFLFKKEPEKVVVPEVTGPVTKIIGKSFGGRNIEAVTFGKGPKNIIFVGAIHGGYEWMTALLAYKMIDYVTANPTIVPEGIKLSIIPVANPDGVFKVTGKEGRFLPTDVPTNIELTRPGRFNGNNVDLNRNFDCLWQATSTWQNRQVSGGTSSFSEPESKALRDYLLATDSEKPSAVVFWHSQANAVNAGNCGGVVLPATENLMNTYALAANYPAIKIFTAYVVTGAIEDWLSKIGIPAITVELKSHNDMEWEKNLAGFKAVLNYYK
jgi:predicted deacylase